MNSKKLLTRLNRTILALAMVLFACINNGRAQTISMSISNCAVVAPNEIQFDVSMTNNSAGDYQWCAAVIRMTHLPGILPAGTNTMSWGYVSGGYSLSFPAMGGPTFVYNAATRQMSVSTSTSAYPVNTAGNCAAPNIPAGSTVLVGRFYLKNNTQNFVSGQNVGFAWNTTSGVVLYDNCSALVTNFNTAATRTLLAPCTLTINTSSCYVTSATTNETTCNQAGMNNGSITVTPGGGTAPFSYSWTGPNGYTAGNTNQITGLAAGSYTVTATDATGCVSTLVSTVVTQPEVLVFGTSISSLTTGCATTAIITLQVQGGQSPYTYSIDGISYQQGNTFNVNGAGARTVYAKDAMGCVATNSVTVSGGVISISLAGSITSTCTNSGVVVLTASGGTAPYTYSNGISGYQSNNIYTNLAPEYRIYYAKDANGCVGQRDVWVVAANIHMIYSGSVFQCGNQTGSLNITAGGGFEPFTYSLDGTNYQSSNVFNNITVSPYTVFVKDANGCIGTEHLVINQGSIGISPGGTVFNSCTNTGSLTFAGINGTAPYQYSIDGVNYQPGNTFYGLPAGSINCWVKDANGCIGAKILQLSATSIDIVPTNSAGCANTGKANISANYGATPYAYSLDGINYQTSGNFLNLGAATYTAYVKDATGCVSTRTFVIEVVPILFDNNVYRASCLGNDGRIVINIWYGMNSLAGVVSYSIDGINYQASNVFNNLTAGTYTAFVRTSLGCFAASLPMILEQTAFGTVTANQSNSSSCVNNGTIQVNNSTGGLRPFSYSIDGINFQPSNVFSGLAPGVYTVYEKDARGCMGTTLVTIGINPLSASSNATSSSSCVGNGKIQLFRTGGTNPYSYSLDGITYQASNLFTGLAAGTYTGYVKDLYGCVASTSVFVQMNASVSVTAASSGSSSCINDGTIQAGNPSGGTVPFTYSIDGVHFQTGKTFAGLAAGSYTVTAKDFYGCTGTASVTVASNAPVTVTSYATSAGSCTSSNGKIQLFRTGGTGPYTYSLDGVGYQTSNLFTNLPAATYDGYVKDSKGCVGMLAGIVVGPAGCAPLFAGSLFSKADDKAAPITSEQLKISAFPNPSQAGFTLILEGYNINERTSIVVTELLGRKVFKAEGAGKMKYEFGNGFIAGIYNVQVLQGAVVRNLKLVKE